MARFKIDRFIYCVESGLHIQVREFIVEVFGV